MKKTLFILLSGVLAFAFSKKMEEYPDPFLKERGFILGKPEVKSMSKLTFSSDGILFLGDSKGASVYALDLKDNKKNSSLAPINIASIDEKIGALIGRKGQDILIHDLAVNPLSQNTYFTVSIGGENSQKRDVFDPNYINDASVLIKLECTGKLSEVSLDNVYYSQLKLRSTFNSSEKFRSGRSKNVYTIRYLNFDNGKLFISGLSNEEFSSTFRIASFPFDQKHTITGVEFYHGAHGQFETSSPINTFINYTIDGKEHLLAAYSCTPLITIPVSDLRDGDKIRARTVAEIGPGSHPIDIRTYKKNGKEFILIANTTRGLIKIDPIDLTKQKSSINYPTSRAGVDYQTLIKGRHLKQLDILNDEYIILLKRTNSSSFDLESIPVSKL